MRAARIVVVGMGALLAGCITVGCSSDGESAYDAGDLDGFAAPGDDVSSPDAGAPVLGDDAGVDATLGQGADAAAPGTDDASDSSPRPHDAAVDVTSASDASDAARPATDGSDAALPGVDASDAGGPGPDASEAGSRGADASADAAPGSEDASDSSLASDDASPDAGPPADDGGAPPEDASDDAPFDAAALCSGFNLGGDAINGLTAETSPDSVFLDTGTTDPTVNPVPAADAVVVTVTTSPVGVMQDLAVGYFTAAAPSVVYVPMTLVATTGETNQEWTAAIPAIPAGAEVSFFVVGHDYCKTNAGAGADYYSNSGSNYHYETQ